ncbi:MAG TPA: magnesium transporter, partial [Anaeromyxobacteraceae bacterium]|nr:magnesium transporter [Anaeromyxobacteraceae bacterium]
AEDLRDAWVLYTAEDRVLAFASLPRAEAEEFFLGLSAREQAELTLALPPNERRSWIRLLPPDDAADLIQEAPPEEREGLVALLDHQTLKEVSALLAYAEDEAGGLMNPRFARVRPDMTVDEAISYLKRQARGHVETIYYAYALDEQQRLVGVVTFRDLFAASPDKRVKDVMNADVISVTDDMDQEAVSRFFKDHDLAAIPVVDREGRMKGIVTVDDIVDVVEEEATEDAHKFGGMEALEAPYLNVGVLPMVRKRAGWLSALFVGEMLTTTAMAFYEEEIAQAVVLATFLPLIISSGGNSGSQASTLVIRAMALGEVRLRDWWRVMRRELAAGVMLGTTLGVIGFARVVLWEKVGHVYGEHYLGVAATVAASLLGVVLLGTLAGSLLPFVLRRAGLDPASASAPFVATLVDVAGVLIYFSAASAILTGSLL